VIVMCFAVYQCRWLVCTPVSRLRLLLMNVAFQARCSADIGNHSLPHMGAVLSLAICAVRMLPLMLLLTVHMSCPQYPPRSMHPS
jgi:hypothetical protein